MPIVELVATHRRSPSTFDAASALSREVPVTSDPSLVNARPSGVAWVAGGLVGAGG